ncbi:hypothetical protein A3766_13440 [Oleiphilus sp. HI0132]|uniref:formyltransferase family protein n=1 Tax=Oleiphilus sp. HI0132 TaxID=1822270 RepID=UPI0007C35FA5|nr:formyltransferase family protein [Oleiphilus sp. HI0132]KZZ76580.1 hypothetical protein A3766_13440 [Oleiphilus sp. HI0132]
MLNPQSKVLFLGKADDIHTERALAYVSMAFGDVESYLGVWGEKLPSTVDHWEGDLIISYLSRWVVPEWLIKRAKVAAINFHPAPPSYPGIGCNNFALYNDEAVYGITCHHMENTVDTGKIIAVKEFPLLPSDTVSTLLPRLYDHQLSLFYDVIGDALSKGEFQKSERKWERTPYTRNEFEELFNIDVNMSESEVDNRIRAVSYGDFQPYITLHGKKFRYLPE